MEVVKAGGTLKTMTRTALAHVMDWASQQPLDVQAQFADFFSHNVKDSCNLPGEEMELLIRDFMNSRYAIPRNNRPSAGFSLSLQRAGMCQVFVGFFSMSCDFEDRGGRRSSKI